MKFSVIIPLYNKAPYIRKALESVLVQTYTDYEVIVVDDGSTDDSYAIADEFVREAIGNGLWAIDEENNCQLPIANRLIRQANAGVSAARNNGVAQAQGEYIAFLDADDWWEPTYLERMAQLITDYPEAGLYGMNYIYYKPGKTRVALHTDTGYINYPKEYLCNNAMMIFTSSSSSMSKKVYDEMGGFPVGIKLGEDFLLWAKIALHYPVAFCNEPLAYYNNDVPVTMRATRNLHKPEHHMLFRMEEIIGDRLEVIGNEDSKVDTLASTPYTIHHTPTKDDWRRLIDKLRVNGLLDYWLDPRYHDLAAEKLKKVDWSMQPASVKRMYKTPIWLLRAKRQVMRVGSAVKQAALRQAIRLKAIRREVKG